MRIDTRVNDNVLEIAVSDTGVGIEKDDLDRLFKAFEQVHGATPHNIKGTGLGLALVREMVQLHGGQVVVQSVVGRGSTFTILLPYDEKVSAERSAAA